MGKFASSFGWSLVVTSLLFAVLVVVKERVLPVRQWLDQATGSDWITHGLLTVVVFLVLGFMLLLERNDEFDEIAPRTVARAVVGAIFAAGAIVAVSYRIAI